MKNELQVGFVGNPNCGKTTLFNAYTGANLKVANWPGVTVEKKEGAMKYHDHIYKLVDLPGIYSLTSYSMEEKLTRQYILESNVDVIINIVDASSLERNLYLTLQLIELGKPVVLALNMMDIVEKRGMEIDVHRLQEMLGIPVVPVCASKKKGIDILMHAVAHHKDEKHKHRILHHHNGFLSGSKISVLHSKYPVVYRTDIEGLIDRVTERLYREYGQIEEARWYSIKLLEQDEEILKKYPIDLSNIIKRNYEEDIINQKYDFIEELIEEVVVNRNQKVASTDRVDKILTNKYIGIPIFLTVMAMVFFLTFIVGDAIKGIFEGGIESFAGNVTVLLASIGAGPILISLIVDGIIAGVGGILSFLPNIFILFLALAFLEDSGYMARVAYLMDGIMGAIGLSGKAFIPMLLGFGCTVPAIMASRSLENMEDRKRVILITPFMSCSAKLPIYILFSKMFFGEKAMLAAYSMYIIGLFVAIFSAFVISKITKAKNSIGSNALLIELPEYKAPSSRTILIYVWEKVREYITKAGTTIFLASILVWFVLNIGPNGYVSEMGDSFGAIVGKFIAPILAPTGLGMWQVVVALIAGLAAKEIVVSSFSVLFSIGDITSAAGMTSLVGVLSGVGFGALNAYSLMVFCLLYTPCIATIAVIKKELKSTRWTLFAISFQLSVAWLVSTLIYQVGKLFI